MTNDQAQKIKYWRETKGYSWRMVHIKWQREYVPDEEWWASGIEYPSGVQSIGKKLCEDAMTVLDEKWNENLY